MEAFIPPHARAHRDRWAEVAVYATDPGAQGRREWYRNDDLNRSMGSGIGATGAGRNNVWPAMRRSRDRPGPGPSSHATGSASPRRPNHRIPGKAQSGQDNHQQNWKQQPSPTGPPRQAASTLNADRGQQWLARRMEPCTPATLGRHLGKLENRNLPQDARATAPRIPQWSHQRDHAAHQP